MISIVTTAALRALQRLDRLDLADLDARDAHGRVGPDRVGRLELRLEMNAVRERDVLGEAEEQQRSRATIERDQADEGVERRGAAAARARGGPSGVALRVVAAGVPGTLPVTSGPPGTARCRPRTPSAGPGAAVFGYGLVCRWLSDVGPLAGARGRAALVVRALRRR